LQPDDTTPTLAVDIGGTRTRVALVAEGAVCLGTFREFPTAGFRDGDDLTDAVCAHAARLRESEGLRNGLAGGLGVSVPGLLSRDFGTVEYCPNTQAIEGYALRDSLHKKTGLPVALEVDCNAAAMAEHRFGAGRGSRRLLVLSLGTGVGVGVLIDGKPLRLTGGCCGDLGHVYVGGARRCSAGCLGCLESAVSVESLEATAPVSALIERAHALDPEAAAVFGRVGASIGIAVASMSSFLRPDLVLLAGGISEAGDSLTQAANRVFLDHGAGFYRCPIRKGHFGATAALIGAALSSLYRQEEL
jgi:glucokinase